MMVQVRNPITDRWVKIDSRTVHIVRTKKSPGPYKEIPSVSHNELMRQVQLRATQLGARLFRQNVGMGWVGELEPGYPRPDGTVLLRNSRPFHAGLTDGSCDLIGWTADGRFLAVEIKTGSGRLSAKQRAFIAAVNAAGGAAGEVRRVEDLDILMSVGGKG
jgi:hypothetical protein